jgi:hypothetical protein
MKPFRTLGLGLVAACVVSPSAIACPGSEHNTRIFFASVPAKVDAPVVAQVGVIKLLDPNGDASYTGLARVDQVIKGTIKGSVIKLVARPTSICDLPFRVGEAGIVIGKILPNSGDVPEFEALAESMNQRNLREKGSMR